MCFAWAKVSWTRSTNNGCAELVTARHRFPYPFESYLFVNYYY